MVEYAQVKRNKASNQKFVNIKRESLLEEGDWVYVGKAPNRDTNTGEVLE